VLNIRPSKSQINNIRDNDRPRRNPPAWAAFSRAIRADPAVNITVRVCWLMAALARRSGFASFSRARMAEELGATTDAVAKARRKLVRLGLFAKEPGWRYRVAGEKKDFTRRCIGDNRLDLASRLHWLLDRLTEKNGAAVLTYGNACKLLNAARPNMVPAVKRVMALGHFGIEQSPRGSVFFRVELDRPAFGLEWEQEQEEYIFDFSEHRRKERRHRK
jgi:hypothetical protein